MDNERDQRFERSVRFVARHYREGALDEEQAWRKFAAGHAIRRRVSLRRYWIAAAVVSLLVGIGTFFMLERGEPDWVAVSTAPGQLKDVYLPDSTLVALAGDSWLRYDAKGYNQERRAVEMKGKAFFRVRRNTARPFSVTLSHTEVEVLGTSFNVLAPDGETCVTTLVEGRVKIADSRRNEITLVPGQQAELEASGEWQVREVDTRYYTAWRDGLFAFKDCSLREIVTTLSSWYRVSFLFSDNELSRLTYTTMIRRYDRVDSVIRILEEVGDFRCERISDDMYLIKRK